MANLTDLHNLALSLPETSQAEEQIAYAVLNKGKPKGFAWVWMERVDPKKARMPNLDVIAVRVRDLHEKEALVAIYPEKFFTEPHYNNFPAILVQLAAVEVDELQTLLTNAWRCQAPAALVKHFDNATLGGTE
ncbi:MAG: MmcQ/YjbR family DNA-binding protein [Chloroflexi bacterium]|nr:MmcQ/YjbR family DNA-binding protein [Chloroflexota bacterium]